MLLYLAEGFRSISRPMHILKINTFIYTYETLSYGNVSYVFINVFISKIWINFYKKKNLILFLTRLRTFFLRRIPEYQKY